jgi:predicted phage tail protein
MASTGIAADILVPLGFALIGVGGVMQVAARRPQRDLGLL